MSQRRTVLTANAGVFQRRIHKKSTHFRSYSRGGKIVTIHRALFATLVVAGISMSTGCCGPCGPCGAGGACDAGGPCHAGGPCGWYPGKYLFGLFGCHGCGPGPRGAWNYGPDPCDCHGNWNGPDHWSGYPSAPTPIAEPTPTPPPLPPAAAEGATTRLKPINNSIRPVNYRNPKAAYGPPPQGFDPRAYWGGPKNYGPASYGYSPAGYAQPPRQPYSPSGPTCSCGQH